MSYEEKGDTKVQVADLIEAILDDDLNKVQSLIDRGVDVNESTQSYVSPLGVAIARNNNSICHLLMNNGALLPTIRCPSYGNPLLLAVDRGNVELVKCALDAGNKFVHSPFETCPLVRSVRSNHVAMVKVLLQAPKCNAGNCIYYGTILHDALFCHNVLETAKFLLESKRFGFEYRSLNFLFILLGMTAESRFRHSKIGSLLLQYGADVWYLLRYPSRNHTPRLTFMWDKQNRLGNERYQGIVRMILMAGILPRNNELEYIQEIITSSTCERDREFYSWVYDVCANPLSLQCMCRQTIRLRVGRNRLDKIKSLPIPKAVQEYISMKQL